MAASHLVRAGEFLTQDSKARGRCLIELDILFIQRIQSLSDHLRSPEFFHVASCPYGSLIRRQRGEGVADLVGHAGEFIQLGVAHADTPERSNDRAPSRRAVTTSA